VPNILARHTGARCSAKRLHACTKAAREGLLPEANQVLAVTRSRALLDCLSHQIKPLAKAGTQSLQPTPADEQLLTVDGIGTILAQTLGLATGAMGRFPTVGHSASDCRGGKRTTISNGQRQGQGNVTNGNPDLEWADMEAAQCALRFHPTGQRVSQRKPANSHRRVARQAVAHTLARACSSIMRDLVPCDVHKAFG
jgi:transposase